jgi:hypothetical protein
MKQTLKDKLDGGLWHDCDYCGGDGLGMHDCGEDTCPCLDPEPNTVCPMCEGEGGWIVKLKLTGT